MSIVTRIHELVGKPRAGPLRDYECRSCESRFALRHYCCPECGGYRVERTTWELD